MKKKEDPYREKMKLNFRGTRSLHNKMISIVAIEFAVLIIPKANARCQAIRSSRVVNVVGRKIRKRKSSSSRSAVLRSPSHSSVIYVHIRRTVTCKEKGVALTLYRATADWGLGETPAGRQAGEQAGRQAFTRLFHPLPECPASDLPPRFDTVLKVIPRSPTCPSFHHCQPGSVPAEDIRFLLEGPFRAVNPPPMRITGLIRRTRCIIVSVFRSGERGSL